MQRLIIQREFLQHNQRFYFFRIMRDPFRVIGKQPQHALKHLALRGTGMSSTGFTRSGLCCKTPLDMRYPSKLMVSEAYTHLVSFKVRLYSLTAFRKIFRFCRVLSLSRRTPLCHRDTQTYLCSRR